MDRTSCRCLSQVYVILHPWIHSIPAIRSAVTWLDKINNGKILDALFQFQYNHIMISWFYEFCEFVLEIEPPQTVLKYSCINRWIIRITPVIQSVLKLCVGVAFKQECVLHYWSSKSLGRYGPEQSCCTCHTLRQWTGRVFLGSYWPTRCCVSVKSSLTFSLMLFISQWFSRYEESFTLTS